MNLWVRPLGQLALLAVALFFFSCEDETSTLGYKNPNSKFKVSYIEIPVESSVVLRDSLRTTNFSYSGETNRFLVGNYNDDVFGKVTTSAFTQYVPAAPTYKVSSTAVYDSVTLQLQFDLYHYGSTSATPQTISIYELDDSIKISKYHFNTSEIPHSTVVGSKSFTVDPSKFDEFATEVPDTVIVINVPLDFEFGHRIFNSNIKYREGTDTLTYKYWRKFVQEFKGIAIKSDIGDKVVGISPSGLSRILVHYHDDTQDSLALAMTFSNVLGFSQVKSDRTGTELEAINGYFQDALQQSDKRYIQSGVGILTKLDFSNFYAFTDTVPYAVINSAELSIESIESSTSYAPPSALSLRIMNANNNRMKKYTTGNTQDAKDLVAYNQLLRVDVGFPNSPALVDNDSVLFALDRTLSMNYSAKENKYSMGLSLFLQQLASPFDDHTKFKTYILHPAAETQNASNPDAQSGLKTVNRAVFPKDKIKLKIYYTKPTTAR